MKTYPCTVQTNITFRNNRAIHKKHPGRNCCFVNFGGLISAFINNYGEGCGCASILDFVSCVVAVRFLTRVSTSPSPSSRSSALGQVCTLVLHAARRLSRADSRTLLLCLFGPCRLTARAGVPPKSVGLVVFGSPASVTPPLFGGAWNSSSVSTVQNVTGTCAGGGGCPLCAFLAGYLYKGGFPGRTTCGTNPSAAS